MKNKVLMIICYLVSFIALISSFSSGYDFFIHNYHILNNFTQMIWIEKIIVILLFSVFMALMPIGFLILAHNFFLRGKNYKKLVFDN